MHEPFYTTSIFPGDIAPMTWGLDLASSRVLQDEKEKAYFHVASRALLLQASRHSILKVASSLAGRWRCSGPLCSMPADDEKEGWRSSQTVRLQGAKATGLWAGQNPHVSPHSLAPHGCRPGVSSPFPWDAFGKLSRS